MIKDITIIVRSVGERTEKLCVDFLKKQFDTDEIWLVKNVTPFSEAIKKTFEIGIMNAKKWTLVIDADIFLFTEKLEKFWEIANTLYEKENCFCIETGVYDNFFMHVRAAGVHLFKTEYLSEAIEYCDNKALRPETYILRAMADKNKLTYYTEMTLGIHDFFQSYESIVSKGIVHCNKHNNVEQYIKKWKEQEDKNIEFYWILQGVKIGKAIPRDKIQVNSMWLSGEIAKSGLQFPAQEELTESDVINTLRKYKDEVASRVLITPRLSKREQLENALFQFDSVKRIKDLKDMLFKGFTRK